MLARDNRIEKRREKQEQQVTSELALQRAGCGSYGWCVQAVVEAEKRLLEEQKAARQVVLSPFPLNSGLQWGSRGKLLISQVSHPGCEAAGGGGQRGGGGGASRGSQAGGGQQGSYPPVAWAVQADLAV